MLALTWGDATDLAALRRRHAPFELIVGADVAYDEDAHAPLLTTLAALAGRRSATGAPVPARVVLALAQRDDGSVAAFRQRAAQHGWVLEQTSLVCADSPTCAPVVILEGRPPPPPPPPAAASDGGAGGSR